MEHLGKHFGEKMQAWAENWNKGGCGKNWEQFGKEFGNNGEQKPWGHGGPGRRGWGGPHKQWGGPWQCGGGFGGGGHKVNRCRVIKKPEGEVVGSPGETVFIKAELRNNTHYPYKPGAMFRNFWTEGATVIEDVLMPVGAVEGMSNFELNIPVKIKDNAAPKEYELMFGMQGPRGWSFGETLIVKLKVVDKVTKKDDDMMLYIKASAFMCKHPESKYSMVECLDAFKAVGEEGEDKVIEFIQKKRQEEAKAFAQEQNESMFKDDDNDDLYS